MWFSFFELIKTVMEKNPRGTFFFEISDVLFFLVKGRRVEGGMRREEREEPSHT